MPIYEFYCSECHVIFQFYSRSINTEKIPACPRSGNHVLKRQVSRFAVTGRAKEKSDSDDLPIDESKMEKAMEVLSNEAGNINEEDPRQAANLMRKLTNMTGLQLNKNMEEALRRLESGENPEAIEADLGPSMEAEDPFVMPEKKAAASKRLPPKRDDTLYDM